MACPPHGAPVAPYLRERSSSVPPRARCPNENRPMKVPMRMTVWSAVGWLCLPAVLFAQAKPDSAAVEFFEKKVRPVLAEHCYQCHSTAAKKLKGGLLLDSRAALLKGGDSGVAVVPGEPDKSRLVEAITYKNVDLRMPPRAKLSDAAIADLTAWVKMGVPWPREDAPKTVASKVGFDLL